jgi:hypothetical protein
VTEPNDTTQRIAQLRANLTQKGRDFFDEWERRSEEVGQSGCTDLNAMADQAWTAEQMPTLSKSDLEIFIKAIQLHTLQVWGTSSGEETVEQMIEEAQTKPDRARDIAAQAQQLQVYAGESISPDMDVREAGEVLKRLLFDPDV